MRTIDKTELYGRLTTGNAGELSREAMEHLTNPASASPVRTPEIIGEEIRSLSAAATATTVWFAVEIGRRLNEAKELVGHGGWLDFLRKETQFSSSTAQNLMRVYREYGANQGNLFGAELANSQTFGNLTYTKALALLALPEEEREEFVEVHDVEAMSTRELQDAIRARDEAIADKGAAEEKAQKLEADLSLAQNALELARKEAADAQSEVSGAEAEAEALRQKVKELEARPQPVAMAVADKETIEKARAEAVAEMQDKLDKAKERAAKAEEKRKAAENALAEANEKLEAARRAEAQAVISNDRDLAGFELLFQQTQEKVNVLHGMLLKVRGRGDTVLTEKLQKALLALSDAVRRCAE